MERVREGRLRQRPSWDQYGLWLAELVAIRSPDPNTQHGCVIVDCQHRVVSTGYNGPIAGLDDARVPSARPDKYAWYLHAEDNATLFARCDLRGCVAYVTGHPCAACFRRLMQAGIRRVVCGVRGSASVTPDEQLACREMAAMLGATIEIHP